MHFSLFTKTLLALLLGRVWAGKLLRHSGWLAVAVTTALFSTTVRAEVIQQDSKHFQLVGNYVTKAAAYSTCVNLLTSLGQSQQTITSTCGKAAGPEYPTGWINVYGGWFYDYTVPNWEGNFWLLNFWACENNDKVRYFPEDRVCRGVEKLPSTPSDPRGNGPTCPSCGNPIAIGPANKVQVETDFDDPGPGHLSVVRTYNGGAYSTTMAYSASFGMRWLHAGDRHLSFLPHVAPSNCYRRTDNNRVYCFAIPVPSGPAAVMAYRPNGKVITFTESGTSLVPAVDVKDQLAQDRSTDGQIVLGYRYRSADNTTEYYDAEGRLNVLTFKDGVQHFYTYGDGTTNDTGVSRLPAVAPVCGRVPPGSVLPKGTLLCITDTWGRQIQYEYDAKGRVNTVWTPDAQPLKYQYDGPTGGCLASKPSSPACSANNLTQVTYPDGQVRKYHYNENAWINGGFSCTAVTPAGQGFGHLLNTLTGITDENANRFASWGVDCSGSPIRSEHAGGVDKVSLSYGTRASDGSQTVAVTSYLGTAAAPVTLVRKYHFKVFSGVAQNDSIDVRCNGCAWMAKRTFDANGNVSTAQDWNGAVASFTYDLTRNLETSRTEALGTPEARTTTTAWHPDLRLPTIIAEPKKLTTFTYNGQGRVLTRTEQATTDLSGSQGLSPTTIGQPRSWIWTYNTYGQILTVTGPRTDVADVTTYSYDEAGNLATVTNPLDQVTSYSNYDNSGRVGHIVAPNGLSTDLTYTPRGWLATRSVSDGNHVETTVFDYDGVGQVKKVTLPDGSWVEYSYDAAQRLTSMSDNAGNTIAYTLDNAGNRIAEQTADANGTLTRQVSRVFDTLNNIKQTTGVAQ